MMSILITGSAGFIGSELCIHLLTLGKKIVGVDNHNNYYDPRIKENRLARFLKHPNYRHLRIDLNDKKAIENVFDKYRPHKVVNLAAQAGVRYSLENPHAYLNSNVIGFLNVLEGCRNYKTQHLIYASTSSVYGGNTRMPFSENHNTNHPLSLYAASKKTNELMAHTYSSLFKIPTTGLRFFTVYGPWGRPDMALFKFTKSILDGNPIDVFNYGKHTRDFTYIDDIVKGIAKVINNPATIDKKWNSEKPDPATSNAPWRIYNIGNSKPIKLMNYIKALEKKLGKKAKINFLPLQAGDVPDTYASIKNLKKKFNYYPKTPVFEGVSKFVDWYKDYFKYDKKTKS